MNAHPVLSVAERPFEESAPVRRAVSAAAHGMKTSTWFRAPTPKALDEESLLAPQQEGVRLAVAIGIFLLLISALILFCEFVPRSH
jgi:hypothetical protein